MLSINMELTVDGLGETLKLNDGTLFIGNEYDNSSTSVYLEDISQVQNKELILKLEELHKVVSEAFVEIKDLTIEVYKNEWMVEGVIDEAKGVA